jgi:ribonuclease P protein component
VLPAAHRVTDAVSYREAARRGRRASSRSLVAHLWVDETTAAQQPTPARVGFVVSKAVGNAVVRNRVRRRLRHLLADRLSALPAGSVLVIRALPASAGADAAALARDVDSCLRRVSAPHEVAS